MERLGILVLVLCLIGLAIPCAAQQSQEPPMGVGAMAGSSTGLAQQARNPLADFYTLPLQYNANMGVGPNEATVSVLNIQPLIPLSLNDKWNLILRPIIPVIWQPGLAPGLSRISGLGDTVLGTFLSPKETGEWAWGAGPALLIPTATDRALGNGKWGVGATAVVVRTDGPWVYGALAFNIWSIDNSSGRQDVNMLSIQPFANYIIPERKGWYLLSAPVINANFEATSGNIWTVPIGFGVGRVFKAGGQSMDVNLAAYYNVIRPDNGPEWQIRMLVQFLFPREQ